MSGPSDFVVERRADKGHGSGIVQAESRDHRVIVSPQ
jgi:hypothetical protein